SSRRRHTRSDRDWSSDVCSSDLVLEMDHVVDRMRDEAFISLVRKMNEEPQSTQQALDALLVARNLERVADHATNISEDVIFWVRSEERRVGKECRSQLMWYHVKK